MHAAFVVQPMYGHVNPTLPLVSELVRRGHRVSFATGPELAAVAGAAGADPVALPTELPEMPSGRENFTVEQFAAIAHAITEDARQHFPLLREHFERDLPDVVCYDVLTFTGQMLAEVLGVPGASLIPMVAANERYSLTADLHGDVPPEVAEVMAGIEAARADFAAEHGVTTSLEMLAGEHVADLSLVFLPREFQPAVETFDHRFRFLGPMIREHSADEWAPSDPDRDVLYISLGTMFNRDERFFKLCLDAFADSRWHVVLSAGKHGASELGVIPPNIEVHARAPQLAVLRHASAHLTHGGMGSIMESLAAGVPLVTVPQMAEQESNAARVVDLGLGERVDPDAVTATMLRESVDRVAGDEVMRTNVDAMRRIIRNCGGATAGADAIEAYVGRAGGTGR